MANLKGLYINNNKLAPSGGSGAIELMDFLDEPASPYTIYGTNKKYSFLLVYAITKDLTGKFIDVIPIDQVREGNPAIHWWTINKLNPTESYESILAMDENDILQAGSIFFRSSQSDGHIIETGKQLCVKAVWGVLS